ncbi:MAG: aryl-sulfate sulfotransferase N-terminal domain-containing protein [Bacteroidia bacterium]|nr:aryl-sulfate sulfotransferase N-terminal domain-containing protein [Bacteroidia bacterium]
MVVFLCITVVIIFSCSKEDGGTSDLTIEANITSILNPSGWAPLTAIIKVETDQEVRVTTTVICKNGIDPDFEASHFELGRSLEVPIIGLYPSHNNIIRITLFDNTGKSLGHMKKT